MRTIPTAQWRCFVALWLGLLSSFALGQGRRPMPTASLPIEPASADPEVFEGQNADSAPIEGPPMAAMRPRSRPGGSAGEFTAGAGLLMAHNASGGQLRFVEYASPAVGISQTLRYQSPNEEDAFYEKQYGMMLGLELHPWRTSRLSPQFTLQAGADRFQRQNLDDLALFGMEAAAGLELKLARAVSFLFQWTEVYYPELKEPIFVDQKPGDKYAGSFQVFFNLRWEGML